VTAYRAKVTSKGQVTVPVEVRRALGLETGDFIALEVRDDYVVATREPSTLEIVLDLAERNRDAVARYASDDEAVEAYFAEDHPVEEELSDELLSIEFPKTVLEGL